MEIRVIGTKDTRFQQKRPLIGTKVFLIMPHGYPRLKHMMCVDYSTLKQYLDPYLAQGRARNGDVDLESDFEILIPGCGNSSSHRNFSSHMLLIYSYIRLRLFYISRWML